MDSRVTDFLWVRDWLGGKGLHFNHRKWLARGALLSERIEEAAPFPDPTLALGARLRLATQLLETLVRNGLPLPPTRTRSTPRAAALTKSAVDRLASHPSAPQGLPAFP